MENTTGNAQGRPGDTATSGPDTTLVGYCQECGRPLTASTLRRVADGVFCLPCASLQHSGVGWQAVHATTYPGVSGVGAGPRGPFPSSGTGDANPGWAALLGMIPGVGAMYNGQYAKGAMHLIVFVILVTLADNLNWVFYWLVWGWVFYQAFDAYHTARARRDGYPLPNPFGWNDLGERFGFHRPPPPPPGSPYQGGAAQGVSSAKGASPWQTYTASSSPAEASPNTPTPPSEPAQSVTDNPYTAPFAPAPKVAEPPPYHAAAAPSMQVPYTPTYVGGHAPAPTVALSTLGNTRRFPTGAIWLIGLGLIFLFGNVIPGFRLSGRWLVPFTLAAVALWSAARRVAQYRSTLGLPGSASTLAAAVTGPAILFTVSFLLALQTMDLVSLRRSWPAILIVWGTMLLLQRTVTAPYVEVRPEVANTEALRVAAPPVRSTSGTGSLGL